MFEKLKEIDKKLSFKGNEKKWLALWSGFIIFSLLTSVAQVRAYWYADVGTAHEAYYTSCDSAIGGYGQSETCEPAPLYVPSDCYFNSTVNDPRYSEVYLLTYGSFYGTKSSTGYLMEYAPDYAYVNTYSLNETYYTFPNQFYSDVILTSVYANNSVISGYSVIYPSANKSAAIHNQLKVGCWRTSPDILGTQNGGFETGVYTTAYDNITYIPNFYFGTNGIYQPQPTVKSDSSIIKVGNNYLSVYDNYENCANGVNYAEMPFYLPSVLGGLYNISYRINFNYNTTSNYNPHWKIETDIGNITIQTVDLSVSSSGGRNYTENYSTIVNLVALSNSLTTFTVKFGINGGGGVGDTCHSIFELDDIHLTSLCSNCQPFLNESYAQIPSEEIPITTTTTTIKSPYEPAFNIPGNYSWLTPLVTPFIFYTFIMLAISAIITQQISKYAKGINPTNVFLVCCIIILMVYAVGGEQYTGYPYWLVILLIIVVGVILAKALGVIGG